MFVMTETFPDWINKMFVDWQAKIGRKQSVEDFARYIGVSRPLVTMWMNGNKKPGMGNIELLADIFGNEIYDIMGLPKPNPYLKIVKSNWEFLSAEKQKQISRMIAEEAAKYETKTGSNGVQKTPKPRKTSGD